MNADDLQGLAGWPTTRAARRCAPFRVCSRRRSGARGAVMVRRGSSRHHHVMHRAAARRLIAPLATWALVAAPVPFARASERPPPPRLIGSVSAILGPRSLGEEICVPRGGFQECARGGRFWGVGASAELRLQVHRRLYAHSRGLLLGNGYRDPSAVHLGMVGAGIGLGAYERLGFIRAEYLALGTFGPPTYRPPFGAADAATDRYGHHAGMISGGGRIPVSERLAIELWIGMMFGPRARRTTTSPSEFNDRVLVSAVLGAGLSFDVIGGRPAREGDQRPSRGRSPSSPK
jgi:hypothetical protein